MEHGGVHGALPWSDTRLPRTLDDLTQTGQMCLTVEMNGPYYVGADLCPVVGECLLSPCAGSQIMKQEWGMPPACSAITEVVIPKDASLIQSQHRRNCRSQPD